MTTTYSNDINFDFVGGHQGGDMPFIFGDNDPPTQDLGGEQHLGWASPTSFQFPANLQGSAEEVAWSAGSATDDLPAEPSKEDLAAENAALKARLAQLETPKTPSRKRTASRALNSDITPPTRPHPIITEHGPIQTMWNEKTSPEQRFILGKTYTSSPAAITPPTPTPNPPAKKRRTTKRDTAAKEATPKKTPARRNNKKKTQHQRAQSTTTYPTFTLEDGQLTLTPEASREPVRPIAELLELPFDDLTQVEKANLLLPMLQGCHPITGQPLDAPGSMALQEQAPSAQTFEFGNEANNNFTADEDRYVEEVAEPTYQSLDQNFTGVDENNYFEDSAAQASRTFDQDFANDIDPEEIRYVEEVAEPAYSQAFDNDNVSEHDSYTQDPTAQALFSDGQDFTDVAASEQDQYTMDPAAQALFPLEQDYSTPEQTNYTDDASAQGTSPFGQDFDYFAYTQAGSFDQSATAQNDDIDARLSAAFNVADQSSTDFVAYDAADQTFVDSFAADQTATDPFDASFFDFDQYANNMASPDFFDAMTPEYGATRQRMALEKAAREGGRRR